jgi:anti-anti-sigma factor
VTPDTSQPTIEVRWIRPGTAQVILGGEHDLDSSDKLADALASAVGSSTHVILDLSTTQFIDSRIINTIVTAKRQADAADTRFNLVLGSHYIVEKALEIAGVLPLLNRVHTLDEALAGDT